MKVIAAALCLLTLTALSEDLTTRSGRKYLGYKVTRINPDGVSISYDEGIINIPYADLPDLLQKTYSESKPAAPDDHLLRALRNTQDGFVVAKYVPAKELSRMGVIRIQSNVEHASLIFPLIATAFAFNAKGEMLSAPIKGTIVDWITATPKTENLQRGIISEIPIGMYRNNVTSGSLETVIHTYDVSAVASAKLSFTIQLENLGPKEVLVDVPADELRRVIGGQAGG